MKIHHFGAVFFLLLGTVPSLLGENDFLQALFDTREPALFKKLLSEAPEKDISKQALLEARFLYYIDHSQFDQIATLSKELKAQRPHFQLKNSQIFSTREDWESVVQYSLALKALEDQDKETFEQRIKEAFWLSPKQANIFGHHIEEYRMTQHMNLFEFPYEHEITPLGTTASISISNLLQKQPGHLLLYLWSPWNHLCVQEHEWYLSLHKSFKEHPITSLALIIEENEEASADAMKQIKGLKEPHHWFQNSTQPSLQQLLRIDSSPSFVLISPTGKVLFNNSSSHPNFIPLLKKELKNWNPPLLDHPGE